jgi:hypothetical protein
MDHDAYPDDMARFLRLSDAEVDTLFQGLPPEGDEDLRDLADFLADAAASLSRPPRTEVQATHLSLLAGAIRTSSAGPQGLSSRGPAAAARPTDRSRKERGFMRAPAVRWASKLALAAATIVLLTAALAFAGVDLPGTAAETAFDKVFGIDLPNQGQGPVAPEQLPNSTSGTAVAVRTTIEGMRSGDGPDGCAFGAAVSAAARSTDADTSHCASVSGDEETGTAETDVGSENVSHAANGLGTAGQASGGAATEGEAHADDGLGIADEASDGAGSAAEVNADAGTATTGDASTVGKVTAAGASDGRAPAGDAGRP